MVEPAIVLASNNPGKLTELRTILTEAIPSLSPDQIVDAASVNAPDVVEDGVTFEANALKKATLTAQATGLIAVADDSGLTVDVLHRSEEHTSELQSRGHLVCRLLLEKK